MAFPVVPLIYAGGMALSTMLGGQYKAKQAQRGRILDALTQEASGKSSALQTQNQGVQSALQKALQGYSGALR